MRKLFYSISIILFWGLLTLGYYETYRIADRHDRIWLMENSEIKLSADEAEDVDLLESGESPGDAVMADANRGESRYGTYFLTEKDGLVLVCLSDRETVYETTSIRISSLPEVIQKEIREGKYLKDQKELYSFLENYSS